MKEIIQPIVYTFFLAFEVVAAMILAFLVNGIIVSRVRKYDDLMNHTASYLTGRLFGDFLFSLILAGILAFLYWILKRFTLLPEGIIKKISTITFFKWQVIVLFCFGACAVAWDSYELLQMKPE